MICGMSSMTLSLVLLLGLLIASAPVSSQRGDDASGTHVGVEHCPEALHCCRFPTTSLEFQNCCDGLGCCTDCDNVYRSEGGVYEVKRDCLGSYECCLLPFLSEEFQNCCFEHGCCPICGFLSEGCWYDDVAYPWGSKVASFPECCVDLLCGARLITSPPYINSVHVVRHHTPTSSNSHCKDVQDDDCIDQRGIVRKHDEEWLVNPCTRCSCHNGEIECHFTRPQCHPAPHALCREVPGDCCPSWDCDTPGGKCPDPNIYGGICDGKIGFPCQSDADCHPGRLCCLVAHCGRRCVIAETDLCNLNTVSCQRKGGKCKEVCDRIEKPLLHLCNTDECLCCVPAETEPCDVNAIGCHRRGGKCKEVCNRIEEPLLHLCNTDDCLCCVPAETEQCDVNAIGCHRRGGKCREVCDRIEEPLLHLCNTDDCFCCVPGLCQTSRLCQAQNGRCSKVCDQGERSVGTSCETRDCICCIPGLDCQETSLCSRRGGDCASQCGEGKTPVTGLCATRDCLCCIPETDRCKIDTFGCRLKGGHCKETCDSQEESIGHLCNTDNCFCCVKKTDACEMDTLSCRLKGGDCKKTCGSHEDPIRHVCQTDNCFCCVPKHKQCQNSTICRLLHGQCSENCVSGSLPINGLCEMGCVCCLSAGTYTVL